MHLVAFASLTSWGRARQRFQFGYRLLHIKTIVGARDLRHRIAANRGAPNQYVIRVIGRDLPV